MIDAEKRESIMAEATDILIQIPKSRKRVTTEPLTAIVKYYLKEVIVYKELNLSLEQKKSTSWYEYVHNYRVSQSQQVRERTKVGNRHKLEDHKTYVLLTVKMLNKNTDENGPSTRTRELPTLEQADTGDVKRYHIEIKFKKPTGIFCFNKKFQTNIKVYPTVVAPFPEDPFMTALDKTLTRLYSSKKHEINVKAELEKRCFTPSKVIKVSFVVANNTDVIISLKTVSKIKT